MFKSNILPVKKRLIRGCFDFGLGYALALDMTARDIQVYLSFFIYDISLSSKHKHQSLVTSSNLILKLFRFPFSSFFPPPFQEISKKKGHPWTVAKGFDTFTPIG